MSDGIERLAGSNGNPLLGGVVSANDLLEVPLAWLR